MEPPVPTQRIDCRRSGMGLRNLPVEHILPGGSTAGSPKWESLDQCRLPNLRLDLGPLPLGALSRA